jgi:hypothetical protein
VNATHLNIKTLCPLCLRGKNTHPPETARPGGFVVFVGMQNFQKAYNTLQQLPAYPQSPSAFIGVHQWLIKRNSRYSSIPATCTERSERIRVKTSMTRKLPFIIYP